MEKAAHGYVGGANLGRAEAEGSLGFAGVSLAPGSWRDPTLKE